MDAQTNILILKLGKNIDTNLRLEADGVGTQSVQGYPLVWV